MPVAAHRHRSWEEAFSLAFDREQRPAHPASSCRPCCGRPSPGPPGKRRRAAAHDPRTTRSARSKPARRHRPGRGTRRPVALARPGDRPQPDRQPHGLQPEPGPALLPQGESILCTSVEEDPELPGAKSIAEGTMASVLCVLLRTPRKRLGVLHLDRGPLQSRSPRMTCTWPTPWPLTSRPASKVPSCCASSANCSTHHHHARPGGRNARRVHRRPHDAASREYSLLAGQQLELSPKTCDLIRIGTPLHDIGKIGIDDAILRKPGKLTPAEFEIMKIAHGQGRQDRRTGVPTWPT